MAPGGADQILRAPFLEDETLELDLQLGDYNWAKLPLTFNALAAMLKGKSTELELMTTDGRAVSIFCNCYEPRPRSFALALRQTLGLRPHRLRAHAWF